MHIDASQRGPERSGDVMGMSGPSSSSGRGAKAMADINVTPLVDVMLVLLIIFMISTPLMVKDTSERLLDLNLPITDPDAPAVNLAEAEQLILGIDPNLRVYVGEELITDCSAAVGVTDTARFVELTAPCFDEIEQKLGANPRLQADETLYLLADTTIPYGFVVGAMNRIRRAGVTRIGMVTNPELVRAAPEGAAPTGPTQ
jgi:biopolymer transport protein TolR